MFKSHLADLTLDKNIDLKTRKMMVKCEKTKYKDE